MNEEVPTYNLYGERPGRHPEFRAHAETIRSRSSRHRWEIRPHRHERLFQILHIRGGRGEALIEGSWHPFAGRCVIVVPERREHGFRFSRDIDGAVITLVTPLPSGFPPRGAGLEGFLSRATLVPLPDDHADTAYLAETLDRAEREIAGDGTRPAGLMEGLVATALSLAVRIAGAAGEREGTGRDRQRIDQLMRMIGDTFRERPPVEYYAARLAISPAHLNRLARASSGKPVSRLVADRVLVEARRDLAFSALPIQEIAARLGFEDPAYFSRFFTHHVGLSPRNYRARERHVLDG